MKKLTVGLFLDIAKAFDMVYVEGLIFKLIHYKFPAKLIKILISYITDRIFQVKINAMKSKPHKIHSGVLQGSLIGLVICLLFAKDIPRIIDSLSLFFADDAGYLLQGLDLDELIDALQKFLDHTEHWMRISKIQNNLTK